MKTIFVIFAAAFCCVLCALTGTAQNQRQTTLETFQSRIGVVLVKGSTQIGVVKGAGGRITVSAIEYLDSTTGDRASGIEFFIGADGTSSPQIDYDEIEPLLKGLERLATLDRSVTELDKFEAVYRTKCNMTIALVESPTATGFTAVMDPNTRGGGIVGLSPESLTALGGLVKDAKAKLDSMKTKGK